MELEIKSNYIYLIGASYRPGVPSFIYDLEQKYFNDNEILIDCETFKFSSDDYQLVIITFQKRKYITIGIPRILQFLAEEFAKNYNLKFTPGRLTVDNLSDNEIFPLNCAEDSIFTLEYIKSNINLSDIELMKLLYDEVNKLK